MVKSDKTGISNLRSHAGSDEDYWTTRYEDNGTSGAGSYGKLAEFKAKTINEFITSKNIEGIIDFGCGDGNQASKFSVKRYTGLDIASTAIALCRTKFQDDPTKKFLSLTEFCTKRFQEDLTISLDVIFHITSDENFTQYMEILFSSSTRFCIIYSSNCKDLDTNSAHVKGRKFTDWIEKKKPNWSLITIVKNEFPYSIIKNSRESSFSDFYIYELVSE